MPHLPSLAVSRSLCLAPLDDFNGEPPLLWKPKRLRHGDTANCMIANLSICVRSGVVPCGCGKVPVLVSWEILDSVELPRQCLPSSFFFFFASRNGCSRCKYTRSVTMSRVSPGVLGKFLHRHNSESPVREAFISWLCPHWHSLADTLCPHTGARRTEKKNERTIRSGGSKRKGLSCHDDFVFFCFFFR